MVVYNTTAYTWDWHCHLVGDRASLGFSVSNWQKVQLNTDLFSDMQKYLYTNQMA